VLPWCSATITLAQYLTKHNTVLYNPPHAKPHFCLFMVFKIHLPLIIPSFLPSSFLHTYQEPKETRKKGKKRRKKKKRKRNFNHPPTNPGQRVNPLAPCLTLAYHILRARAGALHMLLPPNPCERAESYFR